MKAVTPFKPFEAESSAHQRLGPFDWIDAISMLRVSVAKSCKCETFVLTDQSSAVPGEAHRYPTRHNRLMPWLLEINLRYLESDDFTDDTVLLSPDMLVYRNLRGWFKADLGIIARLSKKFRANRNLLFGVQFWRPSGRKALIRLYRDALAEAESYSEDLLKWGADIEPFYSRLHPEKYGTHQRGDLSVHFIGETSLMLSINDVDRTALDQAKPVHPGAPIIDFRYLRKHWMRPYFDATLGAKGVA